MKLNPYIAGNPVGGGEAFIGRSDVLRSVLRLIKKEHENSIVLFGQRRIGKTSVLQELSENLSSKGPYSPVYFDLQDKAAQPLELVLRQLAEKIISDLSLSPYDDWDNDILTTFKNSFLSYIISKLPKNTVIILLFDEFDVLDRNVSKKQAGASFFPYLRDLMKINIKFIKFVFVIGRRLEDLSNVYLSLFKNVKSIHVSLLSSQETFDLVRLSELNDSLKWPTEIIKSVYKLTGGHAYLTQQLCQIIWDKYYDDDPKKTPVVKKEDIIKSIPDVLKSASNALEWIWDGLGPSERVIASALAESGPGIINQEKLEECLQESGVRILIGELQDAPRILEEWDLIQPEENGYKIRVEILRQWLVQRKPLARVQDEIDRILPVADSLFQAAYGLYQSGQLDDAIPLLEKSVNLNPNHLKANMLLAELNMAQGNFNEALKLLTTLYKYNPIQARPRLVQVLIHKSKEEKNEDKRITIYEEIIRIDSHNSQIINEYQNLLEKKGDIAYKSSKFDDALDYYNKSNAYKKIEKVKGRIRIIKLYNDAIAALNNNNKQKSQKLFVKVLSIEPTFKEATRFMHLAVTGIDVLKVKNGYEDLTKKIKKIQENSHKKDRRIEELNKSNEVFKEDNEKMKDLKNQFSKLIYDIEGLKEKNTFLEKNQERLKSFEFKFNQLKQKNIMQSKEITKYKEEKQFLLKRIEDSEKLNPTIKSLEEKNSKLINENLILKLKIKDYIKEYSDLRKQFRELSNTDT